MDADLEELLLGRLCALLYAILADGQIQPLLRGTLLGGLFHAGARTPWSLFEAWADVIEARCESHMDERQRAKPSVCLIGLLKAVRRITQLYDPHGEGGALKRAELPPLSDFKFRALICYGLKCAHCATPARTIAAQACALLACRLASRRVGSCGCADAALRRRRAIFRAQRGRAARVVRDARPRRPLRADFRLV